MADTPLPDTTIGTPLCAALMTISPVSLPVVNSTLSPPSVPCKAIQPLIVSSAFWPLTSSTDTRRRASLNRAQLCPDLPRRSTLPCLSVTPPNPPHLHPPILL